MFHYHLAIYMFFSTWNPNLRSKNAVIKSKFSTVPFTFLLSDLECVTLRACVPKYLNTGADDAPIRGDVLRHLLLITSGSLKGSMGG